MGTSIKDVCTFRGEEASKYVEKSGQGREEV